MYYGNYNNGFWSFLTFDVWMYQIAIFCSILLFSIIHRDVMIFCAGGWLNFTFQYVKKERSIKLLVFQLLVITCVTMGGLFLNYKFGTIWHWFGWI